MRKYHQLLLVIISCISIIVLLTYKSENSRLKDVLSAVHFFSRKDADELRLLNNFTAVDEDIINFNRPLPVWQLVGDSFYAYASYYQRNELVSSGSEVLTLVTGKTGAVVNFLCKAHYDDGRIIQGKFRFQHLNQDDKTSTAFTNYIFYCRLKSDLKEPNNIIYTDLTGDGSSTGHQLRLRFVKSTQGSNVPQTQLAICLDLASFNMSSSFGQNYMNLLEFFIHHYVVGVKQFIVYNGDELTEILLQKLMKHKNIHIHLLPFNFPFANNKSNTTNFREIVKTDCLLRSMHKAKFVTLLEPNEFFFPNAKLSAENSVIYSLNSQSAADTIHQLQTYSVCYADKKHDLLTNSSFYDPEVVQPHTINILRPVVPTLSSPKSGVNEVVPSLAFAHRYTDCVHVGNDGLHMWQNSLRQDFMNNLLAFRKEVRELIYN
ncbi:uncharacterized protein LOC105217376 [Zeugodacus cucurbitae]|uniref:Glycosyltransferase family 92 protein n=1 Tax=Zeugodacus cucurbitae TaxID=28588 RepID=A0A0A1XIT4_ZEUCU|nr:uncharacterized protein LOC105217376 [Zeugodacus cucurbitae]